MYQNMRKIHKRDMLIISIRHLNLVFDDFYGLYDIPHKDK